MRKPYQEEQRIYPDTPFGPCPSVTNVAKIPAKPGLLPAAVKITADFLSPWLTPGVRMGNELGVTDNANELIKAAKKEYKRKWDEAARAGTDFHSLIQSSYFSAPEDVIVPDKFKPHWEKFAAWYKEHGVHPLAHEQVVYHSSKYAGRMDFYGQIGGKLVVNDWKFSNGIWPAHVMQSAAYSVAFEEMTNQPVDAVAVTRIDPKTGDVEYYEIDRLARDIEFDKFSHLLSYWWLEYGDKMLEKYNGKEDDNEKV